MLTLWPSFSLLVFFLVIFLECRTIGGRVTLPLGSFLMVFCYGAIGAPLLALLFQQIPFFPAADVDPASPIAWLIGPPVEELAKALPVIVLAFLTRESRRLSIADFTLIGFAGGAGFGFVEGNLNALVNGTLPSVQHIAAFGLQTQAGVIFFAGHPVSTALVGLAAGIGLRFLPPNVSYAWAPSAFVVLWASFDHGIYNWKLLLAANNGALPEAHFVIEFLHLLTLNGQLQTWLLPIGLVAAQFLEAHQCSKAVGARRDLMLAREWRPWVINEWFVALMRAPLGRAAFAQTLGYFRLRRAYYLATFEARRDPKDVTLSRHARSLEDRLKRERSILFDPPRGTWLLPLPVLKSYAAQWTWRMRWVLVFAVLLLFLFMLDPAGLPDWLRQVLFGEIFAASVVVAGVAFAVWRIILFARLPPPDPLAAEGAACASYYTRALLLGCALVCGMFPTLAVLFGWKAFAPGAAFISGYLPGWIAQGGNLQTLLGLGTIGAAVAPDPRPAGEALRHEIAAADDRMRRLGSEIAEKVGAPDDSALSGTPVQLDAFLETMAELDAERDAQARRQIALDECARQAAESTIKDPAPAVQAVKDEFDRLAAELLESAAKELDAIAALEETYGRAWIEIMQDLDAHDTLRWRIRTPLRAAWQAQNEIGWALRVVEATDECLLPMQLTLLPELDALATTARSERAALVAEGIERIRATAEQSGVADPFDFAVGTNAADEDEAALLAEFASAAPSEASKSFGLRTPQANEEPVGPAEEESAPPSETSEAVPPTQAQTRVQPYHEALDQLIDTTTRDQAYLDTIRHLELSDEPAEADITHPTPDTPETNVVQVSAAFETRQYPPAQAGEVEDLIDAIKRDSGYLDFAKEPQSQEAREQTDSPREDHTPDIGEAEPTAAVPQALDTVEPLDLLLAAHDVSAPVHAPIQDDVGVVGQDPAPDVGQTEQTTVPQEPTPVEPAVAADDAPALELVPTSDDPSDVNEIDTLSVAEPIDSDTAQPTQLEPAATDTPALEIVETADSTSDVVQIDALSVADAVDPETVISQDLDTIAYTDLAEPIAAATGDVHAVERDAVETVPQAADEPAPQPDIEDVYLDDVAATLKIDEPLNDRAQSIAPEPTDLLVLDFDVPSAPDEQLPSETPREGDAHAELSKQEPATRIAEAPEAPRTPDEPPAKTEVRSSLFKRLLKSMYRQSPEPTVQPRRWDGPAQELPLSDTALVEQRELNLENASDETVAPAAAPWLSDLASPTADGDAAKADEASLEPIEWPALKGLADDFVAEPVEAAERVEAPDQLVGAAPNDDLAAVSQSIESGSTDVATDDAAITSETVRPVEAETADIAVDIADVSLEAAGDAEHSPELAPDPVASVEARAAMADDEPQPAPDAMSSAPHQVDEFSSEAVRPAEPETADIAVDIAGVSLEAAGDAERSSELVPEPVASVEARAAIADEEPQPAPDAMSSAPEQVDEFSSKADRLSYLLAKLEGAIQAKVAAEAASRKGDVESAPREPDSSASPAPSAEANDLELRAVEAVAVAEPEPATSEPETTAPDESLAHIAEAAAIAAPAHVAETPETAVETAAVEPSEAPSDATVPTHDGDAPESAVEPSISDDRPAIPAAVQIKPDRLSYLLTKLFESGKRQAPEPTAKPQDAGDTAPPTIPAAAAIEEHADDILDLRLPDTDRAEPDDFQEIEFDTLSEEPAESQAFIEDQPPVEAPTPPPELPALNASPSVDTAEPAPAPAARRAEPGLLFGTPRPPRPRPIPPAPEAEAKPTTEAAPTPAIEPKPALPTPLRSPEPSKDSSPATTPKRDWKLVANATRSDQSNAEDNDDASNTAKKSLRLKTGSGALAIVDTAPPGTPVAAEKTPAKYYGPKHAQDEEDETKASAAQQRALSLSDALTEYYAKAGQPQPPMHTTDRTTLQRIVINGKLEAPLRRGAPWSVSGMMRRGEVAIRLKPGAEQFVEFVPSQEIFGQVPHYYARGVGKGSHATYVPAEYLEYFDLATRQWAPVQRGSA